MRMRKKKHGEERLNECREYVYEHEGEPLTNPSEEVFSEKGEVYLEIGAGKGGFAVGMKKAHPDVSYFAMERVTDCVVLAAERAKKEGSEKLCFIIDTADNLTKIFAKGTVDAIFLNFSDPWSKKGYAKRRLTHARYLAVYMQLLKDGGILRFKTDNVGLFDFSLEQLSEVGLETCKLTRDLHASEWNDGNVVTEYEAAFSAQGVKINMLEVVKPAGFAPEVSPELRPDRVSYKNNTEGQ
jgi:tRNA (guanine-N7-)-methyltransferase